MLLQETDADCLGLDDDRRNSLKLAVASNHMALAEFLLSWSALAVKGREGPRSAPEPVSTVPLYGQLSAEPAQEQGRGGGGGSGGDADAAVALEAAAKSEEEEEEEEGATEDVSAKDAVSAALGWSNSVLWISPNLVNLWIRGFRLCSVGLWL